MKISLGVQTQMFLLSLVLGVIVGMVYDVFRILRRAIKHSWIAVAAEDILFFLMCTSLLVWYLFETNEGEIRIFVIIGMLLGWAVYFMTAGCLVMKITEQILIAIVKMWNIIMAPIRKAADIIKKCLKYAVKPVTKQKNRLKLQSNLLYNKLKVSYKKTCRVTQSGGIFKWHLLKKKKKKSIPPLIR